MANRSRTFPFRVALAASALAMVALAVTSGPALVETALNTTGEASRAPSAVAEELGARLFIADLHADSLLWGRDLSARSRRGHVDLPRLLEGGISLQTFGIVTQFPLVRSMESNREGPDAIGLLAAVARWPEPARRSLLMRAVHQASTLHELIAGADGAILPINSRGDLDRLVKLREAGRPVVGALLAVEGAQALEGRLENVDVLFRLGVRMMSPAHFLDTEIGGSAHGEHKRGLTNLGRSVVARMEERGMTVDVAHASAATIDDIVAIATRPVVFSHGGVKGTCDHTRNLDDRHVRAVAATGGVIGIGYWKTAVCGDDVAAIVRAIRYVADLVGTEHVALGSEFDGAVATPFDATGVATLADALRADGFSDDDIVKIMGRNVVRVLQANLPQ